MILHLEDDFITPEETELLLALHEKGSNALDSWRDEQTKRKNESNEYNRQKETQSINEFLQAQNDIVRVKESVSNRYFKTLTGIRRINADAKKIMDALEYSDFSDYVEIRIGGYKAFLHTEGKTATAEELEERRKQYIHDEKICYSFLYEQVWIQLEACKAKYNKGKALNDSRIKKLINEKISQFGFMPQDTLPEPELPSFPIRKNIPTVHGKATDSIAFMVGSEIEKNQINNTGIIKRGDVELIMSEFDKLSGTLGVGTHKLLTRAISAFTEINHTGKTERVAKFTAVNIPLKEYALSCGYDVIEHETATAEEAEKERLRAKRNLDNARRKVQRELKTLFSSSLSWTEKVKGKNNDFLDVRLIEAKGIKNGVIYIRFSQSFSEYLIKLPITQYPTALLKIDERNPNAYNIGLKMATHFNMDNNQMRGTAQLLKVKTLLKLTNLPNIEKIRADSRRWEDRIKEAFENSLDSLTDCGLLENWEYTHAKGVTMTDEEATSWGNYEEWANALIHFTLKDAPDHKTRLEARAEEKKANQKKTRRTAEKL